jgi:gliding motility-associated-like protein
MIQRAGFSVVLSLFFAFAVRAQVDTEFWFAAPEVTSAHADRPIFLNISSFGLPAVVTISQPANPSFIPIVVNLPANSTNNIDLTSSINMIETKPANATLKTGILIKSDADITAYYEVRGGSYTEPFNSDLFALKGVNALGNKFFIPMQNKWPNAAVNGAWASFDIVATENNTNVTIIPSDSIVGHAAGVPFTITLNRGETYSARATSIVAGRHLTGSYVTSAKLIAITIKDDSVRPSPGGGYELIGDQIIPVSIIGTKYIAVKGPPEDVNYDWVFITATEDNTNIFINGSTIPAAQIDSSQCFSYQLLNSMTSVYVESSKPVYAFHITGFGTELGGAILPPIGCTGSRSITITRSLATTFYLILLVESGGEGNFLVDGLTSNLGQFSNVPGTGGAWKSRLVMYEGYPKVGEAITITNSSKDFHLGVINKTGQYGSGCMYGFFSDFGALELGPEVISCTNDHVILNAGVGKDSYLWSTGESSQIIQVKNPNPAQVYIDTISVSITRGSCSLSDEVPVTLYPNPDLSVLPARTTICEGDSVVLNSGGGFVSYLWDDNSTDTFLLVKQQGTHWLQVENSYGCFTKKNSIVNTFSSPFGTLDLGPDIIACSADIIVLNAGRKDTYLWSNGEITQTVRLSSPDPTQVFNDTISVFTTIEVCEFSDTIAITINPSPVITTLPDSSVICINDSVTLIADGGFVNYLWDDNSSDTFLLVKQGGTHWLEVENSYGCFTKEFSTVTTIDSPSVILDLGIDRIICKDQSVTLAPGVKFNSYLWQDGSTASSFEASQAGTYSVEVTNICGSGTDEVIVSNWNINAPNLFTPNNDGFNDTFFIGGIEQGDWQLSIFNRWGQRVFYSVDYDNTFDGHNLPEGIYYYFLEEASPCNKFKGWLDIKR